MGRVWQFGILRKGADDPSRKDRHDSRCGGVWVHHDAGYGTMNGTRIETPVMIRFGQLTSDEFFVSEEAAVEGVQITNASETDDIVMLKHFGPDNADAAGLLKQYG
jgi:hypothetical protein